MFYFVAKIWKLHWSYQVTTDNGSQRLTCVTTQPNNLFSFQWTPYVNLVELLLCSCHTQLSSNVDTNVTTIISQVQPQCLQLLWRTHQHLTSIGIDSMFCCYWC